MTHTHGHIIICEFIKGQIFYLNVFKSLLTIIEHWKVHTAVAAYAISTSFFNVPDSWQMHLRITALGKFISLSMNNKEKGMFKSEKHQVLKAQGCCGTGELVSNSVK